MYASDWIFCLFCNVLPIELVKDFLSGFIEHRWRYFYSFCLSILWVFKDRLLEEDEFSGILSHIKFRTPERKYRTIEDKQSSQSYNPLSWLFQGK